ncbi:response regulator transcription factor [Litoribacillus peritrichatus]|uniref:Response regulator transcription factor n=1 Tax=Litoribacillus peritrichatus TaxID=718191 RepID=A0ABP7NAQ9_9GAMM
MKLLLIEDDPSLVAQLSEKLTQAGFYVDASLNGEEGLYRSREYQYDLAIIDLGLPNMSGIEVITQLRKENITIPILVLTARSSWQDKVHALNAGADDYLVKPFQLEELIARVQAMLRRAGGYANSELTQGPIKLDLHSQEVLVHDNSVSLTAFEYKLVQYFMLHPNKVASKAVLADYLYEEELERDSNVIEVLVARLRQKLDPDNQIKPIETLRGRGYRFSVKA